MPPVPISENALPPPVCVNVVPGSARIVICGGLSLSSTSLSFAISLINGLPASSATAIEVHGIASGHVPVVAPPGITYATFVLSPHEPSGRHALLVHCVLSRQPRHVLVVKSQNAAGGEQSPLDRHCTHVCV